jgi:hypothetical protein
MVLKQNIKEICGHSYIYSTTSVGKSVGVVYIIAKSAYQTNLDLLDNQLYSSS